MHLLYGVGDYTPNEKIVVGSDADRGVAAVIRYEPAVLTRLVHLELLDGEITVDECNDKIAILGLECLVHNHYIAVPDTGILHGIPGDTGIEGGFFVLDDVTVQVNGIGQVVLGRGGEPCLDASISKRKFMNGRDLS